MKKNSMRVTWGTILLITLVLIMVSGCTSSDEGSTANASINSDTTSDTDDDTEYEYTDLRDYQWHLVNTGQTAFASYSGTVGQDINQESNYLYYGYTGKGVVIAVVDSGLEIAHVDLDDNVVSEGSWDFINEDSDPTSSSSDGDHGTSVAGLISAEDNSIGGRGVASGASLKGFNFISSNQTVADQIASLGGSSANPVSDDVDIFNMSYGTEANDDFQIDSSIAEQLQYGVNSLRDGKGAIYIKSIGNGFSDFGSADCDDAINAGLSCQNGNMDPENTVPWVINVAALNADGERSSYSTAGSNVWISSPGGEFGIDQDYLESAGYTFSDSSDFYYKPALITTDQSGCDSGYTSSNSMYNEFEQNINGMNANCLFTSTFNGSSSSAPILSGAVALILEVNPNFTWRDVKHILAASARQVDENDSGVVVSLDDGDITADYGWITNSAGYLFHNGYGFGALDIDAAIVMAKNYTANDFGDQVSIEVDSGTISMTVPDASADATTDVLEVSEDLIIESVQITVSMTHKNTGDIGIYLTSPSNTNSILLNILNGFSGTEDLDEMVLLTNAFYGEKSQGNWTIKVVDGREGSGNDTSTGPPGSFPSEENSDTSSDNDGLLTRWTIIVQGHY